MQKARDARKQKALERKIRKQIEEEQKAKKKAKKPKKRVIFDDDTEVVKRYKGKPKRVAIVDLDNIYDLNYSEEEPEPKSPPTPPPEPTQPSYLNDPTMKALYKAIRGKNI